MTDSDIYHLLEELRRRLKVSVVMEKEKAIRVEITLDGESLGHSFLYTPEKWRQVLRKSD